MQNDGKQHEVHQVWTSSQVTNAETLNVLMYIIGLFDKNHQNILNNTAQKSCIAMSSRDVRIAMEMQQSADEESGGQSHGTLQQDVGVEDTGAGAPGNSLQHGRPGPRIGSAPLKVGFPTNVCSGSANVRPTPSAERSFRNEILRDGRS